MIYFPIKLLTVSGILLARQLEEPSCNESSNVSAAGVSHTWYSANDTEKLLQEF